MMPLWASINCGKVVAKSGRLTLPSVMFQIQGKYSSNSFIHRKNNSCRSQNDIWGVSFWRLPFLVALKEHHKESHHVILGAVPYTHFPLLTTSWTKPAVCLHLTSLSWRRAVAAQSRECVRNRGPMQTRRKAGSQERGDTQTDFDKQVKLAKASLFCLAVGEQHETISCVQIPRVWRM